MDTVSVKKVMFFCYGSIHAERQIKFFITDPRFDITVVSNHDYNFPNVNNVKLSKKYIQLYSHSLVPPRDYLYPFRLLLLFFQVSLALLQEPIIMIRDAWLIKKAIRRYQPELFYFQTLLYPSFLALFLRNNIPFMVRFFNGDLTWFAKNTGIERAFKKYIIKKGLKESKLNIVNSQTLLEECFKYKINRQKIKVVFDSGVDLNLFRPINKNAAKQKIGVTNKYLVLCPRGVGGFYNSTSIIKAAVKLLSDIPNVVFLFLIDDFTKSIWYEHQKLIENLKLPSECFIAIDKMPQSELPYYYSAADIMVSLSSYDSRCFSMLEAFACGTPALMSDLPAIRETVTDGLNGFLVDPLNTSEISYKLNLLLLDDSVREKFITFNLRMVKEKFSSEIVSGHIRNLVYSEI